LENDKKYLDTYIQSGIEARKSIDKDDIIEIAKILQGKLNSGGKLITFGNGGSAADAQHFAAELSGRFLAERKSLPAIALTTNTSSITAIGNDYDYSSIFSRQVEGLCTSRDFVVGISTSGNSSNVVQGLEKAKEKGAFTLALTGKEGGKVKQVAEKCIRVNSESTPIIQEVHITIIHMICYVLDKLLVP
jgi:D-sedoheptulose 7-phosphate isomerase